ncbi:hypothetical protein [Amycolatopsis decaplanina]|uniref:Uncharacterized protein n=1 Tax=Amycolatopsis decaplanina DSM 44594 TaxID=1284240 RepID=M2YBY1_9PSEU|nr:hypothetical protein [Amycolatopsis decaplanina]EME52382.1 hypothetical protein H074_32784 [Amycolatopsis decaplanina DSM 44594]
MTAPAEPLALPWHRRACLVHWLGNHYGAEGEDVDRLIQRAATRPCRVPLGPPPGYTAASPDRTEIAQIR